MAKKINTEPRTITVKLKESGETVHHILECGSIDESIDFLQDIKNKYPEMFNIRIEIESEPDYYDNVYQYVNFYGSRLETADEVAKRIGIEEEAARKIRDQRKAKKKKTEEEQRALYEKLKEKFGDK